MGTGTPDLARRALTTLVSCEFEQGLVHDERAFKPAPFAELQTLGGPTRAAICDGVVGDQHVELMLSEVVFNEVLVDLRSTYATTGQLLGDAVEC
jgi:hypothetical protein